MDSVPNGLEAHYSGLIPSPALDPDAARRRKALGEFFATGGFPTGAREDWRFSHLDRLGQGEYRRYPAATDLPLTRVRDLPGWVGRFGQRVLLAEGRCINGGETRRTGEPGFGARTLPGGGDEEGAFGSAPGGRSLHADGGTDAGGNGAGGDLDDLGRHPLERLNAALFDCGFRVRVGAGFESEPILLYSLRRDTGDSGGPRMLHPRSVIELGPGSRATVIEAHDGASSTGGWTNPTTLCRVGADAELRHVRLELETGNLIHTARTIFQLGRNARVSSTVFSLGEGQARDDTAAVLTAEGAEADFSGLFLGFGASKADHHTLAAHAARHCASRQLFKNVLADRSRAVFDGKVVVAPGAVGTDASQTNRNLLLSKGARVHTKPRLEINADDVKCAHGAAIGRLDEDALFYLRSRGLGRLDSREMLVRAFAGEVIGKAPVAAARELAEAGLRRLRENGSFAP